MKDKRTAKIPLQDRSETLAEKERRLLAKYPLHIYLMVKAAAKALEGGQAKIKDGFLFVEPPVRRIGPRSKDDRP